MQKSGKEAGQAFERAAAIQTNNLKEPDDAAQTLTEAYKSYRKDEPEDAARVLEQAIHHYTLKGNFRRAATHKQSLAELYEVELGDQKRAMEAYETAAGWFENDNAEAYVYIVRLTWCDMLMRFVLQPSQQTLPQDRRPHRSRRRLLQSHIQLRTGGEELDKQQPHEVVGEGVSSESRHVPSRDRRRRRNEPSHGELP